MITQVGLELVPSSGGSTMAVQCFAKAMPGHTVSFTSRAGLKEMSTKDDVVHVPVTDIPLLHYYFWSSTAHRRIAEEIASRSQLLVCHIPYRFHCNWVHKMAKRNQIPYWFVPHGALDPYVFTYRSIHKKLWLMIFGYQFMREASAVIFSTERERAKAGIHHKLAENTYVLHWPVKLSCMMRRDSVRDRIRKQLQLTRDERILLFVGRLHHVKQPLLTISAFASAAPRHTTLVMMGPDDSVTAAQCTEFAKSLNVRSIRCIGPIYDDDRLDYFLAADGYICLSQKENFSFTTAEAMASGTAPIVGPGVDLAFDFAGEECAWILNDNKIETAAAAIHAWSEATQDTRAAMSARCRHWAQQHLSIESFESNLRSITNNHCHIT